MRSSNVLVKPSFNATRDHLLKPHIEHAFIKRFFITADNPPESIKVSSGISYQCYYDNFTPTGDDAIEVIASFQKWKNGLAFAVIRPFCPNKPANTEQ